MLPQKLKKSILASGTALLMAGTFAPLNAIAQEETNDSSPLPAMQKEASLLGTDGNEIGTVTLTEGENGVVIKIDAANMPSGSHSFHIHETASCTTDSEFKSAGGHLNPDDLPHGFYTENGPHPGDLPNIHVGEDGIVTAEVYNDYVTLSADKTEMVNLLDEDGSAIMIHENPDDYITQPTGGGGARIACAEVRTE